MEPPLRPVRQPIRSSRRRRRQWPQHQLVEKPGGSLVAPWHPLVVLVVESRTTVPYNTLICRAQQA